VLLPRRPTSTLALLVRLRMVSRHFSRIVDKVKRHFLSSGLLVCLELLICVFVGSYKCFGGTSRFHLQDENFAHINVIK
jgi:hypothetical protein